MVILHPHPRTIRPASRYADLPGRRNEHDDQRADHRRHGSTESNETFTVGLSSASATATDASDASATGTINDNDGTQPALSDRGQASCHGRGRHLSLFAVIPRFPAAGPRRVQRSQYYRIGGSNTASVTLRTISSSASGTTARLRSRRNEQRRSAWRPCPACPMTIDVSDLQRRRLP